MMQVSSSVFQELANCPPSRFPRYHYVRLGLWQIFHLLLKLGFVLCRVGHNLDWTVSTSPEVDCWSGPSCGGRRFDCLYCSRVCVLCSPIPWIPYGHCLAKLLHIDFEAVASEELRFHICILGISLTPWIGHLSQWISVVCDWILDHGGHCYCNWGKSKFTDSILIEDHTVLCLLCVDLYYQQCSSGRLCTRCGRTLNMGLLQLYWFEKHLY